METILTRAGCFVAIILLGYLLKKTKFLPEGAFSVLSRIVIRVTLPAAIVVNFSGKTFDLSMLSIILLNVAVNGTLILLAFVLGRNRSREERAFDVLNTPSFNIGTFSLPFCQSFLGPVGVLTTSLFDTGNGFFGLGGAYSMAAMVKDGVKFSFRRIGGTLIRSVPFMTYVVMVILGLLQVTLPKPVLEFAGTIASGNSFLAMLMIGVGFHLELDKAHMGKVVKILSVRYAVAAVAALAFWHLLPFELEVRQALVLLVFSPTTSAAPGWTQELKGDVGLSSALGSVSIVCSIVIMLCLLPVIL